MLTEEEKKRMTGLTDKLTLLGMRINFLGLHPLMSFMKTESIYRAFDKHTDLMDKLITEYKQLRVREVMA